MCETVKINFKFFIAAFYDIAHKLVSALFNIFKGKELEHLHKNVQKITQQLQFCCADKVDDESLY